MPQIIPFHRESKS